MKPDVTRTLFDTRLKEALSRDLEPNAGVFGPNSTTWRYSRDALLFAGAWRAVLLQLAHPWVSRAIEEHSTTFHDPIGRFHRTFRVVWTMIYGDVDRVERISRALHDRHAGIQGQLREPSGTHPVGSAYHANQEEALIWVYATLIDTTLVIQEQLHGPRPAAEKAAYYRESKQFATLFGIDPDHLPPEWPDFRTWWEKQLDGPTLHVTDTARTMGQALFDVPQIPFSRWWGPLARTCTAEIMPEPLRTAYGLPASTTATRKTLQRITRLLRILHVCLPKRVRYVPAYHEAHARLRGRRRGPWLTRSLSRSWIGVPELVIGRS